MPDDAVTSIISSLNSHAKGIERSLMVVDKKRLDSPEEIAGWIGSEFS